MLQLEDRIYSEEEYFALEKQSHEKLFFIDNKIIEIPRASYNHNLIATNITAALHTALEDTNYVVLNSDTKIKIGDNPNFVYPDAVVIFEKPQFYKDRNDIITNPILIVEVLSRSTTHYDTNLKFHEYKKIASFREYVMVNQYLPWIQTSVKIAEQTWRDNDFEGMNAVLQLNTINVSIPFTKIFKSVVFDVTK